MSSTGFLEQEHAGLFQWSEGLDTTAYLKAHYEITCTCEGYRAALGMAMEQSVTTSGIPGFVDKTMLAAHSIRVCRVWELRNQEEGRGALAGYTLQSSAPETKPNTGGSFGVELAIPLRLLAGKPAQLWNVIVGEIPRLGFITRFRLLRAQLPEGFGPGAAFGMAGLRRLLGQEKGPLLCRSMRPAVGLDTSTMARLHREVLVGGFHIVKDDELLVLPTLEDFERHLEAMIAARDSAIQETGERKLYFANLICEPWELEDRWAACCRWGVDGVLVAPWIQGLGTLAYLARQRRMPILAHNTVGELFYRHPDWKIDYGVLVHWLRALGADLFVTLGPCGNADYDDAENSRSFEQARAEGEVGEAMVPILQGGKNPAHLDDYRRAVGSDDFMLIVASWVDQHEGGPREGARNFRSSLS